MTTFLFNIEHSKSNGKMCVKAVEGVLSGAWYAGKPWIPDSDAVREALPYNWRKAWDRAQSFWWLRGAGEMGLGHVTLRTSRGVVIANLTATPYLVE